MHANNEIGTIQPIAELAGITHHGGALFHTDAVQSAGKIPIAVQEMGVDLLSLSAHKMYGPKGAGALYVRKHLKLESLLWGGGQEKERRAGTENVPGIVGLGKACELALQEMGEEAGRLVCLRDQLQDTLLAKIPSAWINGDTPLRLPNTLNITIRDCDSAAMLAYLDHDGLALSAGYRLFGSRRRPFPRSVGHRARSRRCPQQPAHQPGLLFTRRRAGSTGRGSWPGGDALAGKRFRVVMRWA